jgi:ubiquinone/menaquinone biosynthesis C-methylase UbiE
MGGQREIFLASEGDAWFARNRQALREVRNDPVLQVVEALALAPRAALEIGCADGWRLRALAAKTGAACSGVDPSAEAIAQGLHLAPQAALKVGTAEALPFARDQFDLVIYGFCLYLCDRADLFRIAQEGDRVLAEGGHLIVYDFCTDTPYRNAYSHRPGCYSYKMRYGDLFSWNPAYRTVYHRLVDADAPMDSRVAVTVLRKDAGAAYPDPPPRD